MDISGKNIFYTAAGIVSIFAAITAVGNVVVFRSEFERVKAEIYIEITEREIQMREEAICWWQSQGKESAVQMCMQEFARARAIRKSKGLSEN